MSQAAKDRDAHDAMHSGDVQKMAKILRGRGAFYTRRCFEQALRYDLTKVAHWFLEPDNYRKKSDLRSIMRKYGHCQSDLRLWDAMIARFWSFVSKGVDDWSEMAIHPNLMTSFVERELLAPDCSRGNVSQLYWSMRKLGDVEELSKIVGSTTKTFSQKEIFQMLKEICKRRDHPFRREAITQLLSLVANPSPPATVAELVHDICFMAYREFSWQVAGPVIRQVLAKVADVHAEEELIFRKLITTDHKMTYPDQIITLLEEYQVDLFAGNYMMVLQHADYLFSLFQERCQGEGFQIWRGAHMRCIVSRYPLHVSCDHNQLLYQESYETRKSERGVLCVTMHPSVLTPCKGNEFRLDQMYIYAAGIMLQTGDPIGKLVPKWNRYCRTTPPDDTTTDRQAILSYHQEDDTLIEVPVYLPDFLIPAFLHQKSLPKSARSAIAHE